MKLFTYFSTTRGRSIIICGCISAKRNSIPLRRNISTELPLIAYKNSARQTNQGTFLYRQVLVYYDRGAGLD